jgi:hypothetical protein
VVRGVAAARRTYTQGMALPAGGLPSWARAAYEAVGLAADVVLAASSEELVVVVQVPWPRLRLDFLVCGCACAWG